MNIVKLLTQAGKAVLRYAKRNPKATALLVGTAIGGTVGAKVKKEAEKLPDGLVL